MSTFWIVGLVVYAFVSGAVSYRQYDWLDVGGRWNRAVVSVLIGFLWPLEILCWLWAIIRAFFYSKARILGSRLGLIRYRRGDLLIVSKDKDGYKRGEFIVVISDEGSYLLINHITKGKIVHEHMGSIIDVRDRRFILVRRRFLQNFEKQ